MRFMTRLILTTAVLVLTAVSAQAGGRIREAVANWRANRGGCGGCQPAAAPVHYQPAPAVTMPQPNTVVQTSYHPVAGGFDATAYQPIRLGSPVPVCSGGVCR